MSESFRGGEIDDFSSDSLRNGEIYKFSRVTSGDISQNSIVLVHPNFSSSTQKFRQDINEQDVSYKKKRNLDEFYQKALKNIADRKETQVSFGNNDEEHHHNEKSSEKNSSEKHKLRAKLRMVDELASKVEFISDRLNFLAKSIMSAPPNLTLQLSNIQNLNGPSNSNISPTLISTPSMNQINLYPNAISEELASLSSSSNNTSTSLIPLHNRNLSQGHPQSSLSPETPLSDNNQNLALASRYQFPHGTNDPTLSQSTYFTDSPSIATTDTSELNAFAAGRSLQLQQSEATTINESAPMSVERVLYAHSSPGAASPSSATMQPTTLPGKSQARKPGSRRKLATDSLAALCAISVTDKPPESSPVQATPTQSSRNRGAAPANETKAVPSLVDVEMPNPITTPPVNRAVSSRSSGNASYSSKQSNVMNNEDGSATSTRSSLADDQRSKVLKLPISQRRTGSETARDALNGPVVLQTSLSTPPSLTRSAAAPVLDVALCRQPSPPQGTRLRESGRKADLDARMVMEMEEEEEGETEWNSDSGNAKTVRSLDKEQTTNNLSLKSQLRSDTRSDGVLHVEDKKQGHGKRNMRALSQLLEDAHTFSSLPQPQSHLALTSAETVVLPRKKPSKERPKEVSREDRWTREEMRALHAAQSRVPISAPDFWSQVASLLSDNSRTADECQSKWFEALELREEKRLLQKKRHFEGSNDRRNNAKDGTHQSSTRVIAKALKEIDFSLDSQEREHKDLDLSPRDCLELGSDILGLRSPLDAKEPSKGKSVSRTTGTLDITDLNAYAGSRVPVSRRKNGRSKNSMSMQNLQDDDFETHSLSSKLLGQGKRGAKSMRANVSPMRSEQVLENHRVNARLLANGSVRVEVSGDSFDETDELGVDQDQDSDWEQ